MQNEAKEGPGDVVRRHGYISGMGYPRRSGRSYEDVKISVRLDRMNLIRCRGLLQPIC